METCSKIKKHSERNWGILYKSRCDSPVYKDGLCKHHYTRHQSKLVNWGERDNYDPATMMDLLSQRSLKLKNTNEHKLYRCKKGIIEMYVSNGNKWIATELPVDETLFCVKSRI